MNRRDRRKMQQQGFPTTKEPVYNLKIGAINNMASAAMEKAKADAKAAALREIDRQILDRDAAFSLDLDAMVLWSLHVHCGWGKKRIERFYKALVQEHNKLRHYYELDGAYAERYLLKEKCGVDVEALSKEFSD